MVVVVAAALPCSARRQLTQCVLVGWPRDSITRSLGPYLARWHMQGRIVDTTCAASHSVAPMQPPTVATGDVAPSHEKSSSTAAAGGGAGAGAGAGTSDVSVASDYEKAGDAEPSCSVDLVLIAITPVVIITHTQSAESPG